MYHDLKAKVESEVDKLVTDGQQHHPSKQKNEQIRVYIDIPDLNKACPKNDFLVPHMELLIDATTVYKALFFMDGNLGYNQIKMHLVDSEMTALSVQGVFCYRLMPISLKNVDATYQRAMNLQGNAWGYGRVLRR